MFREAVFCFLFLLLVASVLSLPPIIQSAKASPMTVRVPDDYPTIQAAINSANDGDTVFVRNGTYYENLQVNKTIWLIGESKEATIIDANYTGTVVNVTANGVNVTGFTVQHGQNEDVNTWAGICIYKANETEVIDNIISHNGMIGILIYEASNCSIVNNTVLDSGWYGIDVRRSEYCVIDHNSLLGNGAYAFMEGIVSVGGGYNTMSNNLLLRNRKGIWISNEENDLITGNTVKSNFTWNLYLWVAFDCVVKSNVFADCYSGIFAGWGGNNLICRNRIENNSFGVYYDEQLPIWEYNSFYLNNFINNTVQAMVPTAKNSTWDDGIKGNYWSDYNGTDANGDGVGDTTYDVSGENLDNYPLMETYSGLRDVGSIIKASRIIVAAGYSTTIVVNVTVKNHGEETESFNLTFHTLATDFETEMILASNDSATFTFNMSTTGLSLGNHTLWSYVPPAPGEESLKDNNCSFIIRVVIPGDVSSVLQGVPDGTVNMRDIAYLVVLFNTRPNSPNWNPNADVNNDGVVNMKDIAIAVLNFNHHE